MMLTIENALQHETDEGGEGVSKFCSTQIHFECIVVVLVILIGFDSKKILNFGFQILTTTVVKAFTSEKSVTTY